jgi:glyoxylase-like metal-dependent hydrolase (beta-lactamase superfamily II)
MLSIAGRWFEKRKLADDITLIWEPHVVPLLRCNIWHVRGRDRDLMIDTGIGVASLLDFARDFLDKPVSAVATHVHIDHIGNHHEFDECLVHSLEADGLRNPTGLTSLAGANFNPMDLSTLNLPPIDGYDISGPMLTALPCPNYDCTHYEIKPAKVIKVLQEGTVIDLGDRTFEVLHLPGHSPGSIGLWEKQTETLFSGDAIYDGPLIDSLHHSSVPDYLRTMSRLMEVPARVVHAGHDPSFDGGRLRELAELYVRSKES